MTFVEKSEVIDAKSWAKEFPSNFLFYTVIAITDGNEGRRNCSVCQRENEDKIAIYWCGSCDDAMCKSCEQQHRRFKSTSFHDVVDIVDFNSTRPCHLDAKMICDEHKEVYKFYCSDHSHICCMTCFVKQHRQCQNVITVEEAAEDKRKLKNGESLKKDLDDLKVKYKSVVQDESHNAEDLTEKIETARKTVGRFYDDILHRLTKAKSSTLNEINEFENQNLPRMYAQKVDAESRLCGLENNINFLHFTLKHASHVQYLYTVNKLTEQKHSLERILQRHESTTESFDIHFTPHDSLSKTVNKLDTLGSVTFSISNVKEEADRDKKEATFSAQVTSCAMADKTHGQVLDLRNNDDDSIQENIPSIKSLAGISQCEEEKKDEKISKRLDNLSLIKDMHDKVLGVAILDDGRILISNVFEKAVLLCDQNGERMSSLSLQGYVWEFIPLVQDNEAEGIKMISPTEGAVVVKGKYLQFFKITSNDIVEDHILSVPVTCDFTFHRDHYYIGGYNKIMVYNSSLLHVRDIYVSGSIRSIAVRDDTSLCYTVSVGHKLYCITMDESPVFTYSDGKLRWSTGVTVDNDGYIYVCGRDSYNIHQLNHDGKLQRIIIYNLRTGPYCISFNTRCDKAVIGCDRNVLLYDFK